MLMMTLPGTLYERDVNRDQNVSLLDQLIIRNNINQCLDPEQGWASQNACRSHVNWSGCVNLLDLLYVRDRIGTYSISGS